MAFRINRLGNLALIKTYTYVNTINLSPGISATQTLASFTKKRGWGTKAKAQDNEASDKSSANSFEAYWATMVENSYDDKTITQWKETYPNLQIYQNSDLIVWKKAFDEFDRDHDGYISQADLQKTPNFTLEKSKLLKKYDKDQNNLIDLGEFVEAMFYVDKKSFRDNFDGFDSVDIQLEFEKNAVTNPATGKKTMTLETIKKMMKAHSFTCVTEYDAQTLYMELDNNQDGEVDLEDFKKWLSMV